MADSPYRVEGNTTIWEDHHHGIHCNRDERAIASHCENELPEATVKVTYLPPQKTPRWARTVTARPVGTSLGNGNYIRQGVTHA